MIMEKLDACPMYVPTEETLFVMTHVTPKLWFVDITVGNLRLMEK